MPVYEYQREDGSVFEVTQRMSDDALEVCPTTGQKVRRLISGGSGVIYKGEGWYVTDYKKSDKPAETKSEATSEVKTETVKTDADSKTS